MRCFSRPRSFIASPAIGGSAAAAARKSAQLWSLVHSSFIHVSFLDKTRTLVPCFQKYLILLGAIINYLTLLKNLSIFGNQTINKPRIAAIGFYTQYDKCVVACLQILEKINSLSPMRNFVNQKESLLFQLYPYILLEPVID